MGWRAHVVEGVWWPTHVAAVWGGRPTWNRMWGWWAHVENGVGWWTHMAVDGGGRVHEENLNLNLNMSLNSSKIWNKFGEI
jgi:hypothetical protein